MSYTIVLDTSEGEKTCFVEDEAFVSGGISQGYKGFFDERRGPEVFIKKMSTPLETWLLHTTERSFSNERTLLSSFCHRSIPKIVGTVREERTGTFTADNTICMQYIAGRKIPSTIITALSTAIPEPLDNLIKPLRDVCSALAHVHSRGIIHRDCGADNIIIGEDGRGYLIDFSISHPSYNGNQQRVMLPLGFVPFEPSQIPVAHVVWGRVKPEQMAARREEKNHPACDILPLVHMIKYRGRDEDATTIPEPLEKLLQRVKIMMKNDPWNCASALEKGLSLL